MAAHRWSLWLVETALYNPAHLVTALLQHGGQQGGQEGLSSAADVVADGLVSSKTSLTGSGVGLVLDGRLQGSGGTEALCTGRAGTASSAKVLKSACSFCHVQPREYATNKSDVICGIASHAIRLGN